MEINLELVKNVLKEKEYPFVSISDKKGKIKVEKIMERHPSGYMALLEDITFLCLNDDFIESIKNFRQDLKLKIGCEELPFKAEESEAEEEASKIIKKRKLKHTEGIVNWLIVKKINDKVCSAILKIDKNCKTWYQDSLSKLCKRHNLLIGAFTKDYLDDNIIAINRKDPINLSIIEKVIFINNPISFPPCDSKSYSVCDIESIRLAYYRGGYLSISSNKNEEPYIQGNFPIYSTKKDILEAVGFWFTHIESERKRLLEFRDKRDHRKDTLDKDIIAYSSHKQGDSLSKIALAMDKEKGKSREYDGYTQDSIRITIRRMEEEISRFDARPY